MEQGLNISPLDLETLNQIPLPVFLVGKLMVVHSMNEKAISVFSEGANVFQLFGQALKCANALDSKSCNDSDKCMACQLRTSMLQVFESGLPVENRKGWVHVKKNGEDKIWELGFSASLYKKSNDVLMLVVSSWKELQVREPYLNQSFISEIDLGTNLVVESRDIVETKTLCYALNHSPFEVLFLDLNGTILFANDTARQGSLLNVDSDSLRHISQLQKGWNQKQWKKHCSKIIKTGRYTFITQHLVGDNKTFPVEVDAVYVDNGQKPFISYFFKDITVRVRNQERIISELKINKSFAEIGRELTKQDSLQSVALLTRQYALDLTSSSFGFVVYDDPIEERLVFSIYSDRSASYTKEVAEMYQAFTQLEYETGNVTKTTLPFFNALDELKTSARKAFGDLPFERMAWSKITYNNELKGAFFVAGKMRDYELEDTSHLENLSNLFGLAIYRIQSHIQLIKSKEHLALAINSSKIIINDLNFIKGTLTLNNNWFDITEHDKFSFDNTIISYKELIHVSDLELFEEKVLDPQNTEGVGTFYRIKHRNGRYLWMKNVGRVLEHTKTGELKRILWLQIDVTEEYFLNERLRTAKEEAESSSRAKSAFLASMSHEIRTPINSILGFSELLKTKVSSPLEKEYVNNINKSGSHLLALINDILDYSKLEALRIQLQKRPVDLMGLVKEVMANFAFVTREKGLYFNLKVDGVIPSRILLDELRVKQVITNLLSNSIKFTDTGGIIIGINKILSVDDAVSFCIYVEDTGIGISPEAQRKIFQDFYQQEDQDNRKYGGTGLGLGIVKRLVELMGGSIELISETGTGSRFNICLLNNKIIEEEGDGASKDVNVKVVVIMPDIQELINEAQQLLDQNGVASHVISLNQYLSYRALTTDYDVTILTYDAHSEQFLTKLYTLQGQLSQLSIPIVVITNSEEVANATEKFDDVICLVEDKAGKELLAVIEKKIKAEVVVDSPINQELKDSLNILSAAEYLIVKDCFMDEWKEVLAFKSFKKVISVAERFETLNDFDKLHPFTEMVNQMKQNALFFNVEEMNKCIERIDKILNQSN